MLNRPSLEDSPFHPGERAVQERLGVGDIEIWARQVVRDHLPEQHREFHTGLPFLIVAARDDRQRPWATVLSGADGFVSSPDARTLEIVARPVPGDALERTMVPGADLGILGIELATRRRNRVNGRISATDDKGLTFAVQQTFGNCPQYIHARPVSRARRGSPVARRAHALTGAQRAWIGLADTFFIASGYRGDGDSPTFGMDASHRGGMPGFVAVLDDRHIRFPDYAGNNHFNTIGNLVADARIGLLFIDFDRGGLLQLTGTATIDWAPDGGTRFPGARRLIDVEIEAVVEIDNALDLRWQPETGSVRSLRVVDKVRESADVVSFVFEARDGSDLPPFKAGQHLPIELRIPGHAQPVARTYSLSGPPGDPRYRISVKRQPGGLASNCLHDHIEPGAIIDAQSPGGDFGLHDDGRPAVLISAGVGITPMVSMLHALTAGDDARPVVFVHGARDGRHHALAAETASLGRRSNIDLHVAYSHPAEKDVLGRDFDSRGRLDAALVARMAPAEESDFYLCGPPLFHGGADGRLAETRRLRSTDPHRDLLKLGDSQQDHADRGHQAHSLRRPAGRPGSGRPTATPPPSPGDCRATTGHSRTGWRAAVVPPA